MVVRNYLPHPLKIKKMVVGILTPSVFVSFIALAFIWIFLFRAGRQDVFYRVVAFRELFSVFTFFSVFSVFVFLATFFMQSWIMIVLIRRTSKNFPGYEKLKTRYTLVQLLCTVISAAVMLSVSYFTDFYKSGNGVMYGFIEFIATGLISLVICFFLNKRIIKSQTENMAKKQRRLDVIKFSVGIPFAIGITSWLFVFPLQLIIRNIVYNEAGSELWQVATLSLVILIMIVISMIPGLFYILVISGKRLFTRLSLLSAASGVSLIFASFFFSVIPVEIINLAMNLSGSMNLSVKTYAVSAETYPEEMFDNSLWKRSVSENGKFILVQGFTMFSMGNLNLICPASVVKPFKDSLHFKLFNAEFDNTLRKTLSTAAQDCNVIDGTNIPKWVAEMGK